MPVLLGLSCFGCFDSHTVYDGERCRVPTGLVCCNAADIAETEWESLCPFECPLGRRLIPAGECSPPPPPFVGGDAGPPPPPPFDGGPLADAGPPASLACPEVRADASCSGADGLVVVVGQPFELPFTFDVCGCCETTECATRVDPATRTVSLTTGLCPGLDCECDDCSRPAGVCEVPALPIPGAWTVRVNGARAFELPVRTAAGGAPNPSGCATYAEDDVCEETDVLGARPWVPSEVCVRSTGVGTSIEVRQSCGSCEYQGPCVTYVEPRTERDRPPGGAIYVTPTAFFSACDGGCDAVCREVAHGCAIPPLPGAGIYDIVVDGRVVGTLGQGMYRDQTTLCTDSDGG